MKITLDDSGLSIMLANNHARDLAWTEGSGWLRHLTGDTHWTRVPEEVVLGIVNDDLRALFEIWTVGADHDTAKKLAQLLAACKSKAVLSLVKGRLHKSDSDFDAHPDLLNTPSGVVDLSTGAVTAHDPSLLFTKVTKVPYRPGVTHPLWTEALTAVPTEVNRPGFDGGSDSPRGSDHASTEEVSAGIAGAGYSARARGA